MKRWTKEETEKLIKLYNKLDNEELLKHFDRSYTAIYKKARKLGLCLSPEMKFNNRSKARSGSKSASWNGGRKKTNKGYILVLNKEHPRSSNNEGYVFEHILNMERHIGRYLKDDEVVHHINGIKDDNRIENLKLMTHGEHTRLHHTGSKRSLETRKRISKAKREMFKNKELESVINE